MRAIACPPTWPLADKMAATVTVKGTLVKQGGIQAIFIKSVEE